MADQEQVLLMLGRIDGKLDGLHDSVMRHFADDTAAFGAIEQRLRGLEQTALTPEDRDNLRELERGRWRLVGIAAGVGVVLGLLGKYLTAAAFGP